MSNECTRIEIRSNTTSGFTALGVYNLTSSILNNHRVYKKEGGDQHLASDNEYGWTVSFARYTFIVILGYMFKSYFN